MRHDPPSATDIYTPVLTVPTDATPLFDCATSATVEIVRDTLARAGLPHEEGSIEILARDDRLAVRLPGERIAWFALNSTGQAMLEKERRVLRLLAAHCTFAVPQVLHEDASGWELRSEVSGRVDPFGVYERVQRDSDYAYAIGGDLGRILADQHLHVLREELGEWLPQERNWPKPHDLPFLPQVINDAGLLKRIDRALHYHARIRCESSGSVLVHADLGFHNIAVDPDSFRVIGVFDFEGAICGDRHHDFTYMVFGAESAPVLDGALAAYEPATGIKIDRERVQLLNAVAAIGYLAYRHGHPPEEHWCGRTLAMDLKWTDSALKLAGF